LPITSKKSLCGDHPHLLLKIEFSPSLRGLLSSDKPIVSPNRW
jgi:hypothetical protein